jgi:hypothetical protein
MTDPSDLVRALRELSLWNQSFAVNPEMTWAKLMENAAALIESLTTQLAESQRREQAAVSDLTKIANIGTGNCDECNFCKRNNGANGACPPQRDCFDWIGPTRAGEVTDAKN